MKIHKLTLILLLALSANSTAYASYCKLNIRGDNICLDEKALLQIIVNKQDSDSDSSSSEESAREPAKESVIYKVAKVKDMDYPRVTVEVEGKKTTVSVDDLVGAQKCHEGDFVCAKDKVALNRTCAPNDSKEHTVSKVYRNEMIEIETGGFLFIKKATSHIMPVECVDQVI